MTRSEADRRVAKLEADWSKGKRVDPIKKERREALL